MKNIFKSKKKKRGRRRRADSSTLLKMLVLSFFLHAIIIYLIPSIDIFVSAPQYIEVENFLGIYSRESQSESETESTRELAPTALEPVSPEIPGTLPSSPEQNILIPERNEQLPESLQVVKTTQPVKPSLKPGVAFYQPPSDTGDEKKSDIRLEEREEEARLLDDATIIAEQPYERPEPAETPPPVERPPDVLTRNDTFELIARQQEETVIAPLIQSRQPIQPAQPPIPIPQVPQTREQDIRRPLRVVLPEAKDVSEPPPDDVLIEAEEPVRTVQTTGRPDPLVLSEQPFAFPGTDQLRDEQPKTQEPVMPVTSLTLQERKQADLPEMIPLHELSQERQDEKVTMVAKAEPDKLTPEMLEFTEVAPIARKEDIKEEKTEQKQEDILRELPRITIPTQAEISRPENLPSIGSKRTPIEQPFQAQIPDFHVARTAPEKKSVLPAVQPIAPDNLTVLESESVLRATVIPLEPSSRRDRTASEVQDAADALAFPQRRDVKPDAGSDRELPMPTSTSRTAMFGKGATDISVQPDNKVFGLFVRPEEEKRGDITPEFKESKKTVVHEEESVAKVEIQKRGRDVGAFPIEGPASGRKVISKPAKLPRVSIEREVTIRLKFWVHPDGTVGEVLPLQRGDVSLERAAIEYLKGWRFTPATPGSPMVWGIIPITYELQ